MMKAFSFEAPKGLYFGIGAREHLTQLCGIYGTKTLVVTGSSWLEESGWQTQFQRLLSGQKIELLPCPRGEPTVRGINRLAAAGGEFEPDLIIGIGGGSVIDTAKALSGLLKEKEPVENYLEGSGEPRQISRPGIPWIAVPTTSGTGAEVTKNAVIKYESKNLKKSLRSSHLIASYAIVDPELTVDLPKRMTGISGMDALSQLLESYISARAKPMTKALVRDAFPAMLDALRKLASDRKDPPARVDAAYGSLVSGLALANSGLGAIHGFASGLGGFFDIPHGLICASLLVPVINYNRAQAKTQLEELVSRCKKPPTADPIDWLIRTIGTLMERYELEQGLKQYGIDPGLIPQLAEHSAGSSMSGNPVLLSQVDKEALLREVI
jgi:alcohol dehydrogenase class IV